LDSVQQENHLTTLRKGSYDFCYVKSTHSLG
jgi:hypothetical protein